MLKNQLRANTEQRTPRVQIYPRLVLKRRVLLIGLCCLGAYLLIFAIAVIYERIYHARSFLVPFLLANPNLLLWFGMGLLLNGLLQRGAFKRFEQMRQAATQDESIWLAEIQPGSGLWESVGEPIVLKYRTNWSILLTILGFITILVLLALLSNIWLPFSRMDIAFFLGIWILVGACSAWIGMFRTLDQLRADDHGLTLSYTHAAKKQFIPWTEARLFAIDDIPGSGKKQMKRKPFMFELASEHKVICWYDNMKEWSNMVIFSVPVLPEDEYSRQLQRLHALIAQKTGLPLVDLRNKY